ncbi:tudor domain-containing protein 3 [Bulinus truncatus]|nr:tudor domain-containing protein 3 [Bulinus truncatus]
MAVSELSRCGWHINEEKIASFNDGINKTSTESIVKKVLDVDIRDIGTPWLNEDINKGRVDYVEGPLVLQLQKLRVVSAPKDNEESQTAPKLCRLSLTDGHVTCSAVALETIKGLGVNTPPGSKLQLTGTIEVESNFLLLSNKNTNLLGGRVEGLASTWELKKSLAQQSLTRSSARGEGGPPPFVPFGKKITNDPLPKKDNFKSLGSNKDKKTAEEDSEFQQQRQAALNQALQAKSSSGGVKTFGGAKILVNDKDVAKIADMGFSVEEATSALKTSNGNLSDALNSLLSGKQRYQRGGGRGGRGGRGDGRRRGRERDLDEDLDIPINTRPSGPATLFDFLETKIPTKEESKKPLKSAENKVAPTVNTSIPNDSKQDKDYKSTQKKLETSNANAQNKLNTQNKGNYQTNQDSYETKSSQNEDQWNQQTVPPRFAKVGRGDNEKSNFGGGAYNDKLSGTSSQNRPSFRENNQSARNKGGSGYSQDAYDNRAPNYQQGYKYNSSQSDPKTFSDQRNSDYKRRTFNQAGDYSRNNYGDQNGGKKNNYSNSQNRNSARSEGSDDQTSGNRDGFPKPYNNRQPNNKGPYSQNQPGLMPTPYSLQLQQQFPPVSGKQQGYDNQQFTVNNGFSPGVGDTCLAKYWEDNEYYPARIDAISHNGATAIVTYIDFGNQEEIYYSDIHPLHPGWGYSMGPQMYASGVDTSLHDPMNYQGQGTFVVPPMEFTRGGMKRFDNERRKPTQAFYQPPNQKPQ